jgi:hypothetical protein
MKKKKYPEIKPQFLKNKDGKITEVYLPYDVYESIFQEIKELREKSLELTKKKKTR